ncbi:MAG: hypothetical protein WBF17_26655 [Phycisphaerae bacterium]
MNRHGLSWLTAAALLWMAPAGCNDSTQDAGVSFGGSGTVGPIPELVAMARPPISDLPIPIGFDLKEGKSRNFSAAGARYVDHVYKGSADKFAVGRFYKRQMPINRWTLVTDMFVQGDIMLDFEKETERCRITVTDGTFISTEIKVALWTSGRILPPSGPRLRDTGTR